MAGKNKSQGKKISEGTVTQNRKARHEYHVEETIEAGIILTGTEVKSLRTGQASVGESYAAPEGGDIWLINAYIAEYPQAHLRQQHDPRRKRKLLLSKREIERLSGAVQRKGVTLVPLSIFFNARGIAKVSLGIATGKKLHDKREDAKNRDWQRQKARIMSEKG